VGEPPYAPPFAFRHGHSERCDFNRPRPNARTRAAAPVVAVNFPHSGLFSICFLSKNVFPEPAAPVTNKNCDASCGFASVTGRPLKNAAGATGVFIDTRGTLAFFKVSASAVTALAELQRRLQVGRRLSPGNSTVRIALFCLLLGALLHSSSAQTVVGLPQVGNGNPTPASSQMLIDATQFVNGSDMCAKISLACAQLGTSNYPLGATIDARELRRVVIAFPHFGQTAAVIAPCGNYPFSEYHFVLSRMATLPYSSMGMARSGAPSLLKSPEAIEYPPLNLMVSFRCIASPNVPSPLP